MRVFEINGGTTGSTGKIMFGIADKVKQCGGEVMCAAPITAGNKNVATSQNYIHIGSYLSRKLSTLLSKISGFQNCFSVVETLILLHRIKTFNPDVIHLHVLHGNYLNMPILFSYLKKYQGKIVWTMHDCWAMTGQCPYFTMAECDKWKTGCYSCEQLSVYPSSYVDNTSKMWKLKKRLFTNIDNLTIVTPSVWLSELFKQSFMKNYPIKVIKNGIDLNIFTPRESSIRENLGIDKDKFVLLGVAFGWGKRKGLDVFIELAEKLSDDYQIVLVGTDEYIDKMLPHNVISIHRTHNQTELAEIYSMADLFINPTREEVLGMVNIEALACGTPVVTFRTGGSPETIDENCGVCLKENTVECMLAAIENVRFGESFAKENCIERARVFDKEGCYYRYVELFKE